MQSITNWFKRQFANPQVVFLALFLVGVFAAVMFAGDMLVPVIAGAIIAYLLEGVVRVLERRHVPRLLAVLVVFLLFMLFLTLIIFVLLPQLSKQLTQLVQQIPVMLGEGQRALLRLPEKYPEVISTVQMTEVISEIRSEVTEFGQRALSWSVSSVVGLITLLVYFILLPILVFFFLKDKKKIVDWFAGFLPKDYHLAEKVWNDVDRQIGNYIRGKFWEILIVWLATFVTFTLLDLNFAMLLSVLVGLSVLIPFVGAAVATVPVAMIALFQFGWSAEFAYVITAYLVIQGLDGNLLVPLLFSEVVNLHPIAIIVAVLFFGGLWGVWGVFFAIPLATLVQAVITAWPKGGPPPDEAAVTP